MNKKLSASLIGTSVGIMFSGSVAAATLEITIQNQSKGLYFTPVLASAHDSTVSFFKAGESASDALKALAEGGDFSGLASAVGNAGGVNVENASQGPIAPGASASFSIDSGDNPYLSIASMILPSNDGFIGVNQWKIPSRSGTYKVYLNGYDAGTEANDELKSSIPNPPFLEGKLGDNGSGVETNNTNTNIHIHPGNLGGQNSDFDATQHRWLNPLASLTVTVK
ncbi:spondin domain-containing protein [Veronia pacifica]|uniref:Spondin domain-containing protein n=1 Tax=Veronia pacifica TaxID=1080227 RepID=A0A1C3EG94_9GAMM|nr:spondin domain-containing protein [Veronia pacifica]ODA32243.1 hypothetical protein A8L45_13705 [Veronia pacifica]